MAQGQGFVEENASEEEESPQDKQVRAKVCVRPEKWATGLAGGQLPFLHPHAWLDSARC